MMKKKVKKIPKYSEGITAAGNINNPYLDKINTKFGVAPPANVSKDNSAASGGSGFGGNWGAFGAAATAGGKMLMDAFGVDDNSQAGVTLNSSMQGAEIGGSIMPGWGHLIGGIAGGTIGAFKKGSVDVNTGEITYGGIFGRSKDSLMAESDMIKDNIRAAQMTEQKKAEYVMNPNNPNGGKIMAAEGGIVPGEHYASRGEVEVAADGTNAVRYGWDNNGKDTYHIYTNPDGSSAVGNMVFTEEGVKRPNGEKYSDTAEKIINGTKEGSKLRQISLRKLANEMEEQKMNKGIKKTKNGIPAHEGGKSGTTPDLSDMFLYRQPDGKFVMQDINGNRYDVPEMMLPYIQGDEHGYWFGPQTGVGPSAGKWNGSMNFAKQMLNSKNVAKLRNTMTRVLPKGAKPANIKGSVKPVTGTSPDVLGKPKTAQEAAQMARNERTANMWQQLTSKGGVPQKTLEGPQTWATARGSSNLWENPMALQSGDDIASAINTAYYLNKGLPTALGVSAMLGGAGTFLAYEATKDKRSTAANTATTMPTNTDKSTVVMTQEKPVESVVIPTETATENEKKKAVAPKKSSISKPSSGKKTTDSRVTTSTVPSPEDTVVRRPERVYDYEEPVKTVTAPVDDKKVYGRDGSVRYDYTTPERKVTPEDLGRTTNNNNNSYTGSNWRDGLYRMAVLSQPLWDRAEAEPIDWTSPVYKYMPTQIDVTSQLRDADQSYALARYNFANLYPNTGAGMAAGLQAASNRAKQYANIRQYQTNAQNELIGKNVGIYNNWANEHARILNDVYNKTAANRAAARNINRQNIAAALRNQGQMLSDDKKMAMERMKFNILKPAIKSTYEDATANDLINMYNSLFV